MDQVSRSPRFRISLRWLLLLVAIVPLGAWGLYRLYRWQYSHYRCSTVAVVVKVDWPDDVTPEDMARHLALPRADYKAWPLHKSSEPHFTFRGFKNDGQIRVMTSTYRDGTVQFEWHGECHYLDRKQALRACKAAANEFATNNEELNPQRPGWVVIVRDVRDDSLVETLYE